MAIQDACPPPALPVLYQRETEGGYRALHLLSSVSVQWCFCGSETVITKKKTTQDRCCLNKEKYLSTHTQTLKNTNHGLYHLGKDALDQFTLAHKPNVISRPSLWMKNQCTPTKPSARLCLNRKISAPIDAN